MINKMEVLSESSCEWLRETVAFHELGPPPHDSHEWRPARRLFTRYNEARPLPTSTTSCVEKFTLPY